MSRANPRFRRTNVPLPVPAGNVFRVRIVGSIESQLTVTTFYYMDGRTPGSALTSHCTDLDTALRVASHLYAKYVGACSNEWVGTSVLIDSPNNPNLATQTFASPGTPSGGPGHEPTTVSAVITKYTGFKGQAGRGRVYVPAVPTGFVGSSTITNLNVWSILASQMLVSETAGGQTYAPVVFSKGLRTQNPKVTGAAGIINCVARTLLGNTRRRRIGRGK